MTGEVSAAPTEVPPSASSGTAPPILVVASLAHPFSFYYAEILRAEGLNAFSMIDVSQLSPAVLGGYDVVVLGHIPITASQAATLSGWVNDGGQLIAMRPGAQLESLVGLSAAGNSLSDRYLQIETSSGPGAGLVEHAIPFHGQANLYTLVDGAAVATLYSSGVAPTAYPAVTIRQVGPNGGRAAAFAFDLARSVVLARQPIGDTPALSLDPEDPATVPYADEQQRLLANLILTMARRPLPRFWYLPGGSRTALILTGRESGKDSVAKFESLLEASPAGCSVDDWQCVRATSYIEPDARHVDRDGHALDALGFEFGLDVQTPCEDGALWLDDTEWAEEQEDLPSPVSFRSDCFDWPDASWQMFSAALRGVRFATRVVAGPGKSGKSTGIQTGSAMPMRFAMETGGMINVYVTPVQITGASPSIAGDVDALLERALGARQYFGVVTADFEKDRSSADARSAVDAALARGVPVVSARQMLRWLDGRNASTYHELAWTGSTLTFRIETGAGARGLQAMVPLSLDGMRVIRVTANEVAVSFAEATIKGQTYAMFPATAAAYHVTYAPTDRLSGTCHRRRERRAANECLRLGSYSGRDTRDGRDDPSRRYV